MKDKTMKKEIFGINIWLFVSMALLILVFLSLLISGVASTINDVTESTKLCEEKGMVFVDREYVDRDSLIVTCLEFDDDSGLVEERRFRR